MLDIEEICSTDNVLEVTDLSQWDWWTRRQEETKVHQQTKCIPLRFTNSTAFFRHQYDVETLEFFPAYKIYKNYIDEYLEQLSKRHTFNNWLAVLTKLEAGGKIKAHIDEGKWLTQCHRIHLPIQTNEGVEFLCGKTRMNMKRGVFYEINNTKVHGVWNNSTEDRVHLIIDLHQTEV
jgi:hypothetical protein